MKIEQGDWIITRDNRWFTLAFVSKVTAATVSARYESWTRDSRINLAKVIFASPDKNTTQKALEKLQSASGECLRREREARQWLEKRIGEIVASVDRNPQGGDGTAPSRSDESAVGAAETPETPRTQGLD